MRVTPRLRALHFRHRRRAHAAGVKTTLTSTEVAQTFGLACGLCAYCLGLLDGDGTLDHVIPLSKGGLNSAENVVIACDRCNRLKDDRGPLAMLGVH